jgi:triosephosphate isomerase
MIFLSLKTYLESSADNTLKLCQACQRVSQETKIPIIPILQVVDIYRIHQALGIEVWVQHLDPIDPGRNFGWISPYSVKAAGASGAVINHAEHQVPLAVIKQTVAKCREYGLKTLVITDTVSLSKKIIPLKPDYLAFEDPSLIAGNVSIVSKEPENIKKVIALTSIPVLVGAGIQGRADVIKSCQLGAAGILLASAVVKAADPEAALRDLANGFRT